MSVTAITPIAKPVLIDPTKTGTLPISNGTPAAASPERIAERFCRWLEASKKLDIGGPVAVVEITKNLTAFFPYEIRRQGWTLQVEFIFWIASFKATKPAITATINFATAADPVGETFVIAGTASARASDALPYSVVLAIGNGDRDDEQALTSAAVTIETSNEDASDLFVYGRTVRQLPYRETNMELAP